MVVETAEEREARGHPVGQAVPYAAMGGLTGFSSLAEGYMRLDPSGQGEWAQHSGWGWASVTVGLGRHSLWGWGVSQCVVSHYGAGSSVTVGLGRQLLWGSVFS